MGPRGGSISTRETERCPGCLDELPRVDGQTHRYIGASPACWRTFSNLLNAGEPPIAPSPMNAIIGDAYAVQHPGVPSDQAIQSVAVHLLVLYGVFVEGVEPAQALWVRRRALRERRGSRRDRFRWLDPPPLGGSITVSSIVREPSPEARAGRVRDYVEQIWSPWSVSHAGTISAWYEAFIIPDGL